MTRFRFFVSFGTLALALAPVASAQQLKHSWSGTFVEGFGVSLAAAGDVNADGYADILVGSDGVFTVLHPYANVYNGATGDLLWHLVFDDLDPQPMIVASVGDLNGDGHADVILGSGFYNAGLGRARVVSGLDGTTLFQLDSTTPYDGLGWSVCGTGDVDGDGVPDFAVGLVDPTGAGAPSAGLVRIYSGKTGLLLHEQAGLTVGDQFGFSIASAGDADADGVPDLIVGAPQKTHTGLTGPGYARVFLGSANLAFHLTSPHADVENFGFSVGTPGDLDLDGHDELIVGAPDSNDNGTLAVGRVDIFSGATGAGMASVSGGQANSHLGSAVFGVGDSDLDGLADYGIGSNGSVPLFAGDGALLLYPSLGLTEPGLSNYGFVTACVGDTDGDGVAEVAVRKWNQPADPSTVDVVSLLPIGTQLYGASSPGCRGPHRLRPARQPKIGNGIFHVSSDAVAPLARGLLLVSTSADFAGSDSLGLGFPIYVGIDGSQVSYPLLHEWNGSPTQPGHAAARFAIPNRPQLVGTTFYMQGIFVERHACAAAPFGMSSTDAVAVTIQPQ